MTSTNTEHIVSDRLGRGELLLRGTQIRASTVYAWCSHRGRDVFRAQYPHAADRIGDAAIDAVMEIGQPDPLIVEGSDGTMRVERDWHAGHVTVAIADEVLRLPIEDIERHIAAYAAALRTAAAQWDEMGW